MIIKGLITQRLDLYQTLETESELTQSLNPCNQDFSIGMHMLTLHLAETQHLDLQTISGEALIIKALDLRIVKGDYMFNVENVINSSLLRDLMRTARDPCQTAQS